MQSPINPSGYRVVVKQDVYEAVSEGGIVLATKNEEKRQQKGTDTGTLVAVGPLAWKHARLGSEPWAKVGDHVMFARYAGHALEQDEDGGWWHVMNDEDILGVIPKEG